MTPGFHTDECSKYWGSRSESQPEVQDNISDEQFGLLVSNRSVPSAVRLWRPYRLLRTIPTHGVLGAGTSRL